jgi:2-amino-4-hydroxy-6-hydroxymethyldihydropteridine diphosphokinase
MPRAPLRGPERVYLGLGTNLGDRHEILRAAAASLDDLLLEARLSPVYETEPLEYEQQPSFLNAAATGLWRGTPRELLAAVHRIEQGAGRDRRREIRKGPRSLDIDILLFGTRVEHSPELTIPHPRLTERAFVLVPLLDLEPELTDPESGHRLSGFLESLPDQGIYLVSEHPYTRGEGRT